ncbi:MAG: hypothetical protein H7Z10_11645, partial [Gemmatimonadaceae bacterium]|nr:hypothetical protein [Acetobacteraceae bacterium]
ATGLPTGCYPEIRNNVVAVLLQAVAIVDIPTDPAGPDATPAVKAILTATQDHQPGGVGIVVAVLLANGVTAAPVLAAALRLPGAQVDPAIEQTLDRAQHVLTTVLPSVGLEPAFLQATQIASLLDAVDGPLARPPLRAQAQRTRVLADQACQARLIQALDQDFLPKLAAANAVLDDGALMALEGVARGVRRLSLVGRRLGDGAVYDKLLSRTAAGAFASSNTLTRMERLRLAELLVGADAALRLAQVPVG